MPGEVRQHVHAVRFARAGMSIAGVRDLKIFALVIEGSRTTFVSTCARLRTCHGFLPVPSSQWCDTVCRTLRS